MEIKKAVTLVHKGALEIGVLSIQSFVRYFKGKYKLHIHGDPSIGPEEKKILLEAAQGMETIVVLAKERLEVIEPLAKDFPRVMKVLGESSFFAKLELPMYEGHDFFYFDCDIIWLRYVENLQPPTRPNAFSTEYNTWYPEIANPFKWIKYKVPRRVNSGLAYLGEPISLTKYEAFLKEGLIDKSNKHAGDQGIFAFLYSNLELYNVEDLKRTRRSELYNLETDSSAALHFAGKMWKLYMDKIKALPAEPINQPLEVRYFMPTPLTLTEILRMNAQNFVVNNMNLLNIPVSLFRKIKQQASIAK